MHTRQNSSRGSGFGNHRCRACDAAWAHIVTPLNYFFSVIRFHSAWFLEPRSDPPAHIECYVSSFVPSSSPPRRMSFIVRCTRSC